MADDLTREALHLQRLTHWVARLFARVLDVPLPAGLDDGRDAREYPLMDGTVSVMRELIAQGRTFEQIYVALPTPPLTRPEDRIQGADPPVTLANLMTSYPCARYLYMQYAVRRVIESIAAPLAEGQVVMDEEQRLAAALALLSADVSRAADAQFRRPPPLPLQGPGPHHLHYTNLSFDDAQLDETREARLPRSVSWWAEPSPVRPQAAVDLGVSGTPGIRGAPGMPGEGLVAGAVGAASLAPSALVALEANQRRLAAFSLHERELTDAKRKPADPYVAPADVLDRLVGMEWEVQLSLPALTPALPIDVELTGTQAPVLKAYPDHYTIYLPVRLFEPIHVYAFPDLHVRNLEIRSAPVPLRDFPAECQKSHALLEALILYAAKALDHRIGVFLPQSTFLTEKGVWPITKHLNIAVTEDEVAAMQRVWNNPLDIKDCRRQHGRKRLHCRIPYQTRVTSALVTALLSDPWMALDLPPDPEPYFLGYTGEDAWIPYRQHQLF